MRPGPPEAGAHGPDELYDKFTVVKSKHVTRDEDWGPPHDKSEKWFFVEDELTHKDEWIFVVRPEANDGAAVAAIEAYAAACRETYPGLSEALVSRLREKGLV